MSRVRWSPSSSFISGLELAGGLRHVDADDRGAVAVQHPGDLLADAAAGAGDERDLAGQRACPVGDLGGRRRCRWRRCGRPGRRRRPTWGRAGRPASTSTARLGALGDVDELDGAAAADLLAERAGEALERALGDPLARPRPAPAACRARPRAGSVSRLRISGVKKSLQRDQLGGVGDAGGVEDQALVRLALGAAASVEAMPSTSSRPGQRLGQPAACRPTSDGAVDERGARGVALEPGRGRAGRGS